MICPRSGFECTNPLCHTWTGNQLCQQRTGTAAPNTVPALRGWECPRCKTINAPWKDQCDCKAQGVGAATSDVKL